MGKSIGVNLAGEDFSKKEDVKTRIHKLVAKYPLMYFVDEVDLRFCKSLFSYHPKSSKKLSAGVEKVQIRLDMYGNRCFHLWFNDGSDDNVSWKKCLAAIK